MHALRRLPSIIAATALTGAPLCGPPSAHSRPGDLDLQFNSTGWITAPLSGRALPAYMAVQPDGRIILAGNALADASMKGVAVARFHPDGTLDSTFNQTGYVITRVGTLDDSAWNVALQGDGKIVTSGSSDVSGFPRVLALVRYHPDGTLDTSFGNGGKLTGPPSAGDFPGIAIAVQSDGKILVTGGAGKVTRLLGNGTVDASFGTGGTTPFLTDTYRAIVLQPDGKILLAGGGGVTRLLPNGLRDDSFGPSGVIPGGFLSISIALQSDGKILTIGAHSSGDRFFTVYRLNPDGTADTTFNSSGAATCDTGRPQSGPIKVIVQNNGKIIVMGTARDTIGGSGSLAFVRFHANGSLDTNFGSGGLALTDFGTRWPEIRGAAQQSDRDLLVSGYISEPFNSGNTQFLLARYIIKDGPVLSVEAPEGTPLTGGAAPPLSFGAVTLGSRILTITVRNTGEEPLTISSVTLTGESHPGEFRTAPPAVTTLAPGSLTTFPVVFTPAGTAWRTATLRLTTNALNLPNFSIPLLGRLATPLETWRYTWFGATDDPGPGADLSDFDHDGLTNIIEFATGTSPHHYSPPPGTLTKAPDGTLAFTFTRPVSTLTSATCEVQAAPYPDGPWSPDGITLTADPLSPDGTHQTFTALIPDTAPRRFLRLRVTVPPAIPPPPP